ncbi:hypothetical protein MTP99_008780 [Tenebrio molitor]|nr:hypothetical protein MTP99_008780 [Tenebrio molitor]
MSSYWMALMVRPMSNPVAIFTSAQNRFSSIETKVAVSPLYAPFTTLTNFPIAGMTVSRCAWSSFNFRPLSNNFTTATYLSRTSRTTPFCLKYSSPKVFVTTLTTIPSANQ